MRLKTSALVPVLLVALAIAGCGGGDDSSSTAASTVSGASGAAGATPLSEADFVSQANAICADINSQIEAQPAGNPTDLQGIADVSAAGLAIVKPAIEKLVALTPPADLQDKWDAFLAHVQKQTDNQEALGEAAAAGDTATVNQLAQELQSASGKGDQIATDLGLTECAKNVQPQG